MAGECILVVDDNPLNLKVTRLLLASEGYDVRTAGDSYEALAMLQNIRPRLILMDIRMPGMDGLELTRRLRADASMEGVVILALTAYAMRGDEDRALGAGCDGYVAKPIDTRRLPHLIRAHLDATGEARLALTPAR